jgi:hypothetical protein
MLASSLSSGSFRGFFCNTSKSPREKPGVHRKLVGSMTAGHVERKAGYLHSTEKGYLVHYSVK